MEELEKHLETEKSTNSGLRKALEEVSISRSQSSFQMSVESGYVIAITTLSDWLKNVAPVLQPMRCKTNTNLTFSRAFKKFKVIIAFSLRHTTLSVISIKGRKDCLRNYRV